MKWRYRIPSIAELKSRKVFENEDPRERDKVKKQCCGSGMFFPGSEFFHPDPGSNRFRIPDPHQII
jgi:hypothetical protein